MADVPILSAVELDALCAVGTLSETGYLWFDPPCHGEASVRMGYEPATQTLLVICRACYRKLFRIAVQPSPTPVGTP